MASDMVTIILTLEGEKVRPRCEVHHPVTTNHWQGPESLSVCTVRAHVLSPSGPVGLLVMRPLPSLQGTQQGQLAAPSQAWQASHMAQPEAMRRLR